MRDSTLSKLSRLARDLAGSPRELQRYLRFSSTFSKKSPVDWRLPWIAFRAIDLLDRGVRPSLRVLEWGCGGSTLYFADRGCHVVSIEHDANWASIVRKNLSPDQQDRVEIQCHDAPRDLAEFEVSRYVSAPMGQVFDLVLIDGFTDYHGPHRRICFETAEKVIAQDALIFLDDTWMFEPIMKTRASWVHTFTGVGPARPGVTTTSVFAYGARTDEAKRVSGLAGR